MYDPDSFFDDEQEDVVLGYINEEIVYLPPAFSPEELDCLGKSLWTFKTDPDDPEKVTGQVADQFSCFGGKVTVITGGQSAYECAEGTVDLVDITDDFYEGGGYILWDIVDCGRCDI